MIMRTLDGPARAPRPGSHPQMMTGPQAGAYPQGYAPPVPGGQGHQPYPYAPQQGLPQQHNAPQQHGHPQQHAGPRQQSGPQRLDQQ
ncbi:MAG TPA: hypothetical protein VGP70_21155 [Actinomadura sp.]|nr:hypothetical protein [Actinomadura sp.]